MLIKKIILIVLYFFLFAFPVFPQTNNLDIAALAKEGLDYNKAITSLEKLEFKDDKIKEYLARLYYLNGDSTKAINFFSSLTKKEWYIFVYMGLAYEDLKDYSLAITCYQKSLKIKDNSLALYRLSKIYYNQHNFLQAINFFKQVIMLDPSIRIVHYYLGLSYLRLNQYKDAYNRLAKVCKFYPKNEEVIKKLNITKKYLGKEYFAQAQEKKELKRKEKKLLAYKRQEKPPYINVGIASKLKKCRFKSKGPIEFNDGKTIWQGEGNKFYNLIVKANKIILYDYDTTAKLAVFTNKLLLSAGNNPFYILDIISGDGSFWHKEVDHIYRGDFLIKLENKSMVLINKINIEEYLYGVLPSEIPASAGLESLKAQAVAARTAALKSRQRHKYQGFDVCADCHCQVYEGMSKETPETNKAVDASAGEVLSYQGELIDTFYHANCGGALRSDAFGKRPYLANKFDSLNTPLVKVSPDSFGPYNEDLWFLNDYNTFCAQPLNTKFRWQRIYDQEDFQFIFGYPLKEIKSIIIEKKDQAFHCKDISLERVNTSLQLYGDLVIRDYFDKLKSSSFKVEIKYSLAKEPKMLLFFGAGFGHGSGLCQEGAIAMAKAGYDYKQILKHYYPNTKLQR